MYRNLHIYIFTQYSNYIVLPFCASSSSLAILYFTLFTVQYCLELPLPLEFPINWQRRSDCKGNELEERRVGYRRERESLAGIGAAICQCEICRRRAEFTVINPTARLFLHSRSSTGLDAQRSQFRPSR